MKRLFIYILIFVFCLTATGTFAENSNKYYNEKTQIISLNNVNLYDFFYETNNSYVPKFIPLTKKQESLLDRKSKQIYKKVLKSEKAFQRALTQESNLSKRIYYYHKAIKYNPQNYMAIAMLSEAYLALKDYNNALYYAQLVISVYRKEFDFVYYVAGAASNSLNDLNASIRYFDAFLKNSNESSEINSFVMYLQAMNYFYLDRYSKAIDYANLSLQKSKKYEKENTLLKYYCYYIQKKYKYAKQEAWKLVQLEPSAENYMKMADNTENLNDKLIYLNTAKRLYYDPKDIFYVNCEIAKIEQNKINNVHKKMGVYSPKPDWFKISNENIGSISYWNNRQDEFFASTNSCIAKYKGSDLAKCFSDVINNEKEKTMNLKKSIYDSQMLYLQLQQLDAIQDNNKLQRQQNYLLNRPSL